jgi:hypothetical protein
MKNNPQEAPGYYGYQRYYHCGYAKINQCQGCGNVSIAEDNLYTCKHCGGDTEAAGTAKWIEPAYIGFLWWKKQVSEGYWLRSVGHD